MKVKQLNSLATDLVGDGHAKNVFFFTVEGDVQLIGTDFATIHTAWRNFVMANPRVEAMVEDRQNGVVASAGIEEFLMVEDGGRTVKRWAVCDESKYFGLR